MTLSILQIGEDRCDEPSPTPSPQLHDNADVARSAFLLLLAIGQFGQSNTGELRVKVTDAVGLPLPATVELVSEANRVRQGHDTDSQGNLVVKRLPFGSYRVGVTRQGFAVFASLVEIKSALPADLHVTLSVAPIQTEVSVTAADTLLNPHQTMTAHRIGAEAIDRRTTSLPGRSLLDLVNTQPGWLVEANGILHPRGSEYQTQYVVDGLPLTDNRSPAFAPELGADDVHAINILTGGYPAEYGRKLGGVIEVVTTAQTRRGLHGSAALSAGSFGTTSADGDIQHGWSKSTVSAAAGFAATDRYLDPPVEENYTNRGSTSNASVHVEHDLTRSDRFGVIVRRGHANFLVPNERVQQKAGQRQDRDSVETIGQFSYQRVVSANVVGDVRGMARDVAAGLWSNAASTPIVAEQDRGFRDVYLKGAVSAQFGAHEMKTGGELNAGTVRERFAYRITDPREFGPGTPGEFSFAERRADREQGLFIQDQVELGSWTVNAGLRWDHYRLVVEDSAFSPRLAVAWSWPGAGLVLRGSYDRAFQTPAFENLLLASSRTVDALSAEVLRLPVPPSRGNFYEAGLSKLFGPMRVDASYYSRQTKDVGDDDVLLNTGVSFPIAFRHADIRGTEVKLDLPRWKNLSGFVSYSRLRGVGDLPVTGGLFLGAEGTQLLQSSGRFAVTQDQRHTLRSRASYRLPRGWIAGAASYDSGLPFKNFNDDPGAVADQFGQRVVDRVNFDTGRVRPSFSLDASLGFMLLKTGRPSLRLQAEGRNLTNRLDVINFAGLFSGTALAPPRSLGVRLRAEF
jgi:outer membrane cobalamin receptor